jgi:hypothetical protein
MELFTGILPVLEEGVTPAEVKLVFGVTEGLGASAPNT